MGTKERLIEFIAHLGLRNAEFERTCGLSNGFVQNTNDRIRRASLNQISAAYPQLNMDWLVNGRGEMLLPEEQHPTNITELVRIVSKLVEQGETNAEANRINAEANLKHAQNFERLISLIGADINIEKAIG